MTVCWPAEGPTIPATFLHLAGFKAPASVPSSLTFRFLASVTLGSKHTPNQTTPGPEVPPDGHHAPPVRFTVAALTRQGFAPGFKKSNQDAYLCVHPYRHGGAVWGVMDGHGAQGEHVSQYVTDNLPAQLLKSLDKHRATARALDKAFHQVDADMNASGIDTVNSGTTAVVSLLQGRTLTTAWVGDSRAVLGTRSADGVSWVAVPLTEDHKPELPGERRRIEQAGGRVDQSRSRLGQAVGPWRVWLPHQDYPGLAMSRALGDRVVRPLGVTCTPDVTVHQITPKDGFLVVASDGVFEYFTNQQVVDMVGRSLQQGDVWATAPQELEQDRAGPGAGAGALPAVVQSARRAWWGKHGTSQRESGTQQEPSTEAVLGGGMPGQGAEAEVLPEGPADVGSGMVSGGGSSAARRAVTHACSQLVGAARDLWVRDYRGSYVDDITAVVVAFEHGDRPTQR